jgi:HD domain
MRLVAVEDLDEGLVLGRSQFDNKGIILVPAGFKLKQSHLGRLQSSGVGRVPVMELESNDVPPGPILRQIVAKRIDLDLGDQAATKHDLVTKWWSSDALIDTFEHHPAWVGTEVSPGTRTKLIEVLEEAAEKQSSTLLSLPELPPNKWLEFGVRCACLSVILAHEFNYPVRDMIAVASASLIHFIGRSLFESIATEETSINDLEKVLAREHPTFTSLIVRGSDPDSDLEHVILLQQEERFNGKGFPQGLRGSDQPPRPQRRDGASTMLPHSELVNVALGFERLRADPVTNLTCNLLTCVEEMVSGTDQVHNSFAIETLCLLIQRFPVGSRVKIRGNSSGKYLGFSGIVRKAVEDGEGTVVKEIYITRDPHGQDIDPIYADFSKESQMSLVWS